MIGEVLNNRYEIIEEIGKGGMANVYKARCVLLNRIVAIKILRDDLDGGEEFLERFNAEAQAAASLDHPNIVSIFDVGIHNNRHYITMEYVDGRTLKEFIAKRGNLEYKEALKIAWQIADALTAAHEKNIVHRDIKPHNILITNSGDVKVADFGIARFGTEKTISTNNDILGSVHYISPEQAKGLPVDNRSDIYSLGVVLYEMLCGVVPFDSDNPVSVAMMQIDSAPSEISKYVSGVPESCQHIVFKAMTKNLDMRYQNAEEIKADIISVLNNPEHTIDNNIYNDSAIEQKSQTFSHELKTDQTKTGTKITMIILAAITSFVIVLGGYLLTKILTSDDSETILNGVMNNSDENIEIPTLMGKNINEAKKICEEAGLKLIVDDEVEDETKKPGTIISQSPSSGTMESPDKTIRVIITKDVEYIELKNYVGQNYEIVQQRLLKLELEVNIKFEESRKPDGEIIKHTPEAGEQVKRGDVVTLYVSMPQEEEFIEVPNLIGKTYSEAKAILQSEKLKVGASIGKDNPKSYDIVIEQSIPAGSKVAENCAISLTFENDEPIEDEEEKNKTEQNNSASSDNKKEHKTAETQKTQQEVHQSGRVQQGSDSIGNNSEKTNNGQSTQNNQHMDEQNTHQSNTIDDSSSTQTNVDQPNTHVPGAVNNE